MESSLSNLVDNLTARIQKIKCKDCGCFLEYKRVQGNLQIHKSLFCNKCYLKKLNGVLKKKFKNTFKFSNNDVNEFILLLKKVFIFMNLWMIGKTLMKQHYLKKRSIL